MKTIGVIVTFLTAIALSSVIHGWALMKLWGWFIFPAQNAQLGKRSNCVGRKVQHGKNHRSVGQSDERNGPKAR